MGRGRIDLSFVKDPTTRKHRFNIRKKCVFAKAHELKTLCNVDVCVIVHNPFTSQPEVYPEIGARPILEVYQNTNIRVNKISNEKFLLEKLNKLKRERVQILKEIRRNEMKVVLSKLLAGKMDISVLSSMDLADLYHFVQEAQTIIEGILKY